MSPLNIIFRRARRLASPPGGAFPCASFTNFSRLLESPHVSRRAPATLLTPGLLSSLPFCAVLPPPLLGKQAGAQCLAHVAGETDSGSRRGAAAAASFHPENNLCLRSLHPATRDSTRSKSLLDAPRLQHLTVEGPKQASLDTRRLFHRAGVLCADGHATSVPGYQDTPLEGREQMEYDVVIVGAGPAGLSAAIRLKQLDPERTVCVIEKGAQAGSHILSGNVFEPRALNELFPDWRDRGAPLRIPVMRDKFLYFPTPSLSIPVPPPGSNHGNFVISLSELVRWLAAEAEQLGVEVYPGISGSQLLFSEASSSTLHLASQSSCALGSETRRVAGVVTGDVGRAKDGAEKDNFQPGMVLMGKATLLAEGCRGSLSMDAIRRYGLVAKGKAEHQTYALGIKEVWQVQTEKHRPGEIVHTLGYPLDMGTYGGGFLYHMDENMVALGLVVALDYANPYLNIFQEFQKWKLHPQVRKVLEGGTVLQYGARTLNEGGFQSIPELVFPGGALVGCAAGFLNVPKIKGTHTAMKSGMLAAEAINSAFGIEESQVFVSPTEGGLPMKEARSKGAEGPTTEAVDSALSQYPSSLKKSWVWDELYRVRNVRPGFRWGLFPGLLNSAFEVFLSRGRSPWTIPHGAPDNAQLRPLAEWKQPAQEYPKPDGKVTFDILTSVYRSSTNHSHDEPPHLSLLDPEAPTALNLPVFGGPETRYCPAKVYEYVQNEKGEEELQINAQNCLHCKACDIKDPSQNIRWTVPEGGGGPGYTVM